MGHLTQHATWSLGVMKYILRIHAAGKHPEVDLDKASYERLKKARATLSHALAMEEEYDILISNYLEFEREMLDHALQSMIRRSGDYEDFFRVRMDFNRRLMNLLTAARLYVHQLHRHVAAIMPHSQNTKDVVARLFSAEYEDRPEYRFMEALRNYVQHRGLPVHLFQFNTRAEDSGNERLLIYSMEIASEREHLEEDDAFKKNVLDEIPEEVDLKVAARVYVEGISRVHVAARKLVERLVAEARSMIENALASYQKVLPESFVGLRAICLSNDRVVESVPLLLDWDDVRMRLCKRNSQLVNLRNRYVSGQIKDRNK